MKTTHFLKMTVLVTCFSLLLWNCQEDVIVTSQNKNITQPLPKYNIKTVSFNELQTNTAVQQKLKELKTILIKNRTTHTQKVYNINTLNALFIQNSQTNLHTYTFAVNNTENQTSLENVVLSKQPNGSYNAYAITYTLSSKERSNLANGVPVNVLYKTTITPIKPEQLFAQNRGPGGCYKFKEVGIEDCSCHDTHASGGCTHPETIYEFVEVNCPGGAGNGISDGSGDSGTSDGLSGSGGGSNGGSTVTYPVDFQDPRCPAGSGKVLVNDICQCTNGKVEDSNGVCNCPEGTIIDPSTNTCVEDDKIINNLTGKAKCVYDKLTKSSTDFKTMIQKFDGDFPVSHLKLTINNSLDSGVFGITLPPVNYVTEIQINGNGVSNLSDLGAATTFAHELIHAEIFRKMLSAAKKGDLNYHNNQNYTTQDRINYVNSLKDNFPGLYDYYWKRYKSTWNHNMMATHYRTTIADIIQNFDNNRLSRSTYESIAWAGLGEIENNQSTVAWQNLTSIEQQAIIDTLNQYFFNGTSNCN
ncbi:hypothetical protein ACQY1Q_16955 [Tenacibaculum sp. TC6]|uniref:hypothetical protein n=1 Tax=Tenacibaculum sp. TC6 TaxID=3423223 RepID=UPI003D36264A